MKKTIITFGALSTFLFVTFAVLHHLDNPSIHFESYKELEDSGIIDAGWVPDYLPRSSFNIEETHNIDTNVVSINFQYLPGDNELARKSCIREIKDGTGIVFICNEGILKLSNDGEGYFSNSTNGA